MVATTVETIDGLTRMVYHQTAVVSWNQEVIILNTGGYKTVTTKRRMNQASKTYGLGFSVFQRNYNWYVEYQGKIIPFDGKFLTLRRLYED